MIQVRLDDIFAQEVDAIVNPANTHMLHGGGLAGMIARRAGRSLVKESQAKAPIRTGEAIHSTAGKLPFRGVIHAVGPVWNLGNDGKMPYWRRNPKEATTPRDLDALLCEAHLSSMRVAGEAGYGSIAFPAISCGVFHYPVGRAAPIAVAAVRRGLDDHPTIKRVVFCLLDEQHYLAFKKALDADAG